MKLLPVVVLITISITQREVRGGFEGGSSGGLEASTVWDGQCVQDFPYPNRTLEHFAYTDFQNNSVALCKETCLNQSFILAGVEAQGHCFCGNTAPSLDLIQEPPNDCTASCPAYGPPCGGPWLLNVYSDGAYIIYITIQNNRYEDMRGVIHYKTSGLTNATIFTRTRPYGPISPGDNKPVGIVRGPAYFKITKVTAEASKSNELPCIPTRVNSQHYQINSTFLIQTPYLQLPPCIVTPIN